MQKQKGFTLIELLVVMGIIAILVAIGAPNFLIMQNGVEFRDDPQQLLDALGEVRSNALSNKKCIDNSGVKHDALKWSVYLRKGDTSINIYCQWDDGSTDKQAFLQPNEGNYRLDDVTDITYVGSEITGTYNADSGFVLISYLSGTGQAKIETFTTTPPLLTDLNGTTQNDIRVTFNWARGNNGTSDDISVCIDEIGGFMRLSGSQTCAEK